MKKTKIKDIGKQKSCCLCGGKIEPQKLDEKTYYTEGHNADPCESIFSNHNRCCDICNYSKVIPARLSLAMGVNI
tara:strand:+ start:211 stop:435 length:225 start_codon:yes stop_codon:yes gene_type:complete